MVPKTWRWSATSPSIWSAKSSTSDQSSAAACAPPGTRNTCWRLSAHCRQSRVNLDSLPWDTPRDVTLSCSQNVMLRSPVWLVVGPGGGRFLRASDIEEAKTMFHPRFQWAMCALALTGAVGCGSFPVQAGTVKKVFVIAMENHNWTQPSSQTNPQQIFQNPAAPF